VGLTKRDGQVPALDDINPTARMFSSRCAARASGKTTCSVIARLDRPAERPDACRGVTRAARMSH